MKTKCFFTMMFVCAVAVFWLAKPAHVADGGTKSDVNVPSLAADIAPAKANQPIPWSEIGAKAGADYQGDGLSVSLADDGARLRCVFQLLDGEATPEGLWLVSTVTNTGNDHFQVKAAAVGRGSESKTSQIQNSEWDIRLENTGKVSLHGQSVQFTRPGLLEEYSVSMDGVRQDFVVLEKPVAGDAAGSLLRVELSVTGARVEATAQGAQLVLEKSSRKIAYGRLRVTDAVGKELPAWMEVKAESETQNPKPEMALAVVVNDTGAVYPIRIDPTFSDANWNSMGGIRGANNQVLAAAADGLGNLYIGGDFTLVGNANASRVAKWNGTNWSALGRGVNDTVYSLATSGSDVYVGGIFQRATNSGGGAVTVNYIAKWDGTNWSTVGGGMNFDVFSLAASGSDVYAGGIFTRATNSGVGVIANRIAKWNGSAWNALGSGLNGQVMALTVSGNDVYAGGIFTVATNTGGGTVAANNIAKWNGSNWSTLGGGVNSQVAALAVMGSDIYAGGNFAKATNSGGVAISVNYIGKWDGTSWSALGAGLNSSVAALTSVGSDLYALGNFTSTFNGGGGSISATRAAKWDGSTWSALGTGLDSQVNAVAAVGSDVYAGGNFTMADGTTALSIAKWNGTSWSAPGTGMNGSVSAIAVSGSDVYAGGAFTTAGEVAASFIAKWNGSSWSALGTGLNNNVFALTALGSDLYAGGNFTMAGGSPASRIAKWDGTNWSALGGGMNNSVSELTVGGSNVYAGGSFTIATNSGGVPVTVNRIAEWNGSSWGALGAGVNSQVFALAGTGSDLYAGGSFTMATNSGGAAVAANSIAKWDGSSWSALGGGVNSSVNDLAVSGSNVYAGGNFIIATNGGVPVTVNRIARWNGNTWSALGRGVNSTVDAVAVWGGDLYAGGNFLLATNTSGVAVPVNYIAKWDGTNWNALGSGMNKNVFDLAVAGNDLYAGGFFTTAGGKVSGYIAKAQLNLTPPGYNQITPQLLNGGQIQLSYAGMVASTYALDRAFSLSPPVTWNALATNVTAPDGSVVFTNTPVSTTNNFWRIRSVP